MLEAWDLVSLHDRDRSGGREQYCRECTVKREHLKAKHTVTEYVRMCV